MQATGAGGMAAAQMKDQVADVKAEVFDRLVAEGALGQIRARMRANVYTALLVDEEGGPVPECLRPAPRHLVSIVADFLQQAQLGSSLEVFRHESEEHPADRPALLQELGGCFGDGHSDQAQEEGAAFPDGPVLGQVLEAAKRRAHVGAPGVTSSLEGLEVVSEDPRGVDVVGGP
mmetsp:Transcript_68929/g.193386  ORF Transcript_68929/g.193386 Transcript_68929/m.193386 type:complete len:175 (+) Transcript_68929:61-585(+)